MGAFKCPFPAPLIFCIFVKYFYWRITEPYPKEMQMLNGSLFIGFVAAALVVLILPGPGVLYIIARSVSQGYRAGLVSVLGLSAGALVHVAAAAGGLSALLLTSATAFSLVKMLGAGYLIYLGFRTLLTASQTTDVNTPPPLPLGRLFADGVIISLFNPKIAVFFLAFLPQFVDLSLGAVPVQIVVLGLVYVALALLTDGGYACLAGRVRPWLKAPALRGFLPRILAGGLYMGLGIYAALAERPR